MIIPAQSFPNELGMKFTVSKTSPPIRSAAQKIIPVSNIFSTIP